MTLSIGTQSACLRPRGRAGLFTVAAVLTLSLAGCKTDDAAAQAEPTAEKVPARAAGGEARTGTRVEVAVVEPSVGSLSIRVPGEVEGVRDAQLAAPLGGYIEKVLVEEGEHVKEGTILARVDTQTHSTRLIRAKVERDAAIREFERAKSLQGTIPQAEIDATEDRVAAAKATLRELDVNLARSVVRAPFAGVLVQVEAEVGEVAAPGVPLFRIVKLQPVHVSVALSDRDMSVTKVGMPAQVSVDARSGIFSGKVLRISQAAQLKTRSFEAIIEVPNENEALLPGMIAQVSLTSHPDGTATSVDEKLVISQDWLVTKLDGVGVFVEDEGKAVWRPVKLGEIMRRQIEVLEGLEPGDRLIIVGHRTLADGDPVLVHRQGRCCEGGRAVFGASATKTAPPASESEGAAQ